MRRAACLLAAGWLASLAFAAHAAAPIWISWSASTDGPHTYAAAGYRLALSSKPGADGDNPTAVLKVSAPGAPPLTLEGVPGFEAAGGLVGVVQLDPKATRPAVLLQTFSAGAHCCTTLDLAVLSEGAWRKYELTFDGDVAKEIVDTADGAPPMLLLGDENFDYAFASHAGSLLLPRAYAVRGGRLYDISGEPRLAGRRRDEMSGALAGCRQTDGEHNGACAAYVAAASLAGQHDQAWRRMLTLYDRQTAIWPNGCRVEPSADGCPKGSVLEFKSFPAALAWFLWRYGYAPPSPTFECVAPGCPVAWPRSRPLATVGADAR